MQLMSFSKNSTLVLFLFQGLFERGKNEDSSFTVFKKELY